MHSTSDQRSGRVIASLIVLVLALCLLPAVYPKGSTLSFLSQVAIISVFALSYNMLLGQTGLLSFGHAVYAGLGGYCAIHLLNKAGADALGLGMLALPLVGGIGGGLAGFIFGYISTRRAGTTFAMITLGIAEMMVALALLLPGMSGGEAGITTNRMLNAPVLGINLGSDMQVYYFVWAWMFISAALMYAFTRTPLGRLANAVRDNPERVAFIGFNPQKVRWAVMVIAGIFAGIAGGLSVINYELVTIENLGVAQSGMVLIATYLGGAGYFFGPVVGAFVYVLFLTVVSTLTKAWLLYFGIVFISVVIFAPDGLMGLVRRYPDIRRASLSKIVAVLLLPVCIVIAVEALYQYQDRAEMSQIASAASVTDLVRHSAPLLLLAVAYVIAMFFSRRRAGRGRADQLSATEHAHD